MEPKKGTDEAGEEPGKCLRSWTIKAREKASSTCTGRHPYHHRPLMTFLNNPNGHICRPCLFYFSPLAALDFESHFLLSVKHALPLSQYQKTILVFPSVSLLTLPLLFGFLLFLVPLKMSASFRSLPSPTSHSIPLSHINHFYRL